jgi:transcription factor WhiB
MTTTARRALRAAASARLVKALVDLAAAGLRTHCSDVGTGGLWLSESEDDRREAIKLCRGCPAFDPCGEAAESNRETFGVWASEDFTRTGKPGPKPKAAA